MVNIIIDRYSDLRANDSPASISVWQTDFMTAVEDLAGGDSHGLTAAKEKVLPSRSWRRNCW